MAVERVAAVHYRRQVSLARRASTAVARLWRQVDRGRIGPSWRELLSQVLVVVSSAQAIAAASAATYVDEVLREQGLPDDADGTVRVAGFAGIASDGRPLDGLLYQPAIVALRAIGSGVDVRGAMVSGQVEADLIVRTQVADAGRVADGVAVAARPRVAGYVRMVVLPSCGRCIILAGRFYRWNAGFSRHPRCDCRHIPASEDTAGDLRTDPRAAVAAMSEAEQDRSLGKAGARAVRDGGDLARVVNARRGMYVAGGRRFTSEATTRRGMGRRVRLMPEKIYREAGDDRGEAIRLLRLHGYLI